MKTTFKWCSIAFLGFLSSVSAAPPKIEGTAPREGESIYLHCFRPTYGQKVVLDPSKAMDTRPATPPTALITLKVEVGSDFDVSVGERRSGNWLVGETFLNGDRPMARFEGMFGTSSHRYEGPFELEKVFDPDGVSLVFSASMPFRCVFSRHKEVQGFLDAQAILDAKQLAEATERTRRNVESRKKTAEQGVAPQSATRSESDSEGGDKPQPESEARSR